MKIYIWDGDQEQGPFSRAEVFALLKGGTLEAKTRARWENQNEWQPLKEVLEKGTSAFFSLEEIKKQQEETPSAPVIIPDLLPRVQDESGCEPETKGKGKALVLTAFAIVFAACGIFFLFNTIRSKELSPPEAVAQNAVLVKPTISPVSLASTDSSTPAAKQAAPPPQIEPPPIRNETNANGALNKDLSKERNALEVKPSEVAESTPSPPPTAIQTPPVIVESEVAQEKTPVGIQKPKASTAISKNVEINPFETREVSESELVQILQDRFSYNGLAKRIGIPNTQKLTVYESSFILETTFKTNPKIEIRYAIPLKANRAPGPNASNFVFRGDWPSAMEPMVVGVEFVNGKRPYVKRDIPVDLRRYFCDSLGCTVFTMLIHTSAEILNDQKECYFYGGTEWVDLFFRAQEEIVKRHHLRKQKVFLYGHSLGGTFVERIAAARPESVAAVVAHSAPEISIPIPNAKSDTVWFLGINRGDSMQGEYAQLYKTLIDQKRNVVFNIFPPDYNNRLGDNLNYHLETPLAEYARNQFLKGILDKQTGNGQNISKSWPYVRDRRNPVGTFLTTSPQAKKIPELCREYLPTKDFVDALQDVPAPMQTVTLGDSQGQVKCFVGLPPLGKAAGIAVYLHKPALMEIPRWIDNIYFLAGKGFLVIAPKIRKFDVNSLQLISQFIKRAQPLRTLPVTYVGWSDANNFLWRAIADLKVSPPHAVATVGFQVTDDFAPEKLPVGGGVRCPLLFVYDERPLMDVSTSEEARKSLETVSSVKQYVKECRGKGQFARVAVVMPPPPRKDGKPIKVPLSDQQAINYAGDFITKVVTQKMSDINLP